MLAALPARRAFVVFIACAMALSLVATLSSPVRAAPFTVDSTVDAPDSDPGDGTCDSDAGEPVVCTLRAAIEEANAFAGLDVITVPAGTFPLSFALNVTDSLTITGAPPAATMIVGGDDRVLRLQSVGTDITVNVSGVTITGGSAHTGAGIKVRLGTTLNLANSVVSGNTGTPGSDANGGGINVQDGGAAVITGSTVSGNTTEGGGGGIYVESGGTLDITGSVIKGNTAVGDGGGIYNESGGIVELTGSTVGGFAAADANDAGVEGGGIWSSGNIELTTSTVAGNHADDNGGGIYMGGPTDELAVDASTISGNTSDADGGGIYSDNLVMLHNSTVSGNTAADDGGGVFVDGTLESDFTTVTLNTSANRGGGIWTQGGAKFYATIVANNDGAALGPEDEIRDDCWHNDTGVDSFGSNIDSDDSCLFDQTTDQRVDPRLGPLADNDAATQTHALLFDSLAVDAVQPAVALLGAVPADFLLVALVDPTCPATDQRGILRPQDGDSDGIAVCDIGAYELLPPAASITDVTVTEGNSGTVDAVFTVTLSRPSTGTVSFAYATANGTATVVLDYQAAASTVTFAPGDVSETITVKVVGDAIDEPNETFVVNLTAPVGATLADAQGTGTIVDDDAAAGLLSDTATAGGPVNVWGAPGLAIVVLAVSTAAVVSARRRKAIRAR